MRQGKTMSDDPVCLDARNTLKSLAGWTEDEDFVEAPAELELPDGEEATSVKEFNAPRGDDGVEFWPEKAWRTLVEALPDALVVIDKQGIIRLVNAQTEGLFGYKRDDMVGRKIEKLIPDRFKVDHVDKRDGYFRRLESRPMGARLKLFGRRKDGSEFPVEISLSPLITKPGTTYATSVIRDITQRKRQEAKFETLVENIPAVTFIAPLDDSAPELYVSPEIERMLGFSQKEWLEDPVLWHRQLHPEDRERWNRQFAPTCASGTPFKEVYRFKSKKGKDVWVLGSASVVRDADGQPSFLQGVAFDITSIKEAEEERDRFFVLAIDLYCVAGFDGYFKRINPAFISALGYSERELLSSPFTDFVHPDDRQATQSEVVNLAGGGAAVNFENRFRCKSGSYKWLQWTATPYLDQHVIYAAARDITEQKRNEETLREYSRLALLRAEVSSATTLGDSLPEMLQNCAIALTQHLDVAFARIWTFNEQENVLEMQASAGMYTHRDGPHGRVPVGQFKIGLIASRRRILCTNTVVGDERIPDQEWVQREGMVAFAGYPLVIETRLVGVLALFSRTPFSQAVLQTLELLAAQISLGIDRKWKEELLRRSNVELERRVAKRTEELESKTKELEHFAAAASHDLKKPIGHLKSYPKILREKYGGKLEPTAHEAIDSTIAAAERLERLIRSLEQYARAAEHRVCDPTDSLVRARQARDNLLGDIEENGVIVLIADESLMVLGDGEQLVFLFQNLIGNAIKYRDPDRPLRVDVGARRQQEDWLFWVRDNGVGIEKRFLPKLFVEWAADARVHRNWKHIPGNGYGLQICKTIVRRHGGNIWVESEFGVGTTFYFTLPAVESSS